MGALPSSSIDLCSWAAEFSTAMVQSDKAALTLGLSPRTLESRDVVRAADFASISATARDLVASRFGLFWIWAAYL